MLQLRDLNQQALRQLSEQESFPPEWQSMAELELLGDRWLERLRSGRADVARDRGGLARVQEKADRLIRTKTIERLDRPEVSDARKIAIVRALHRLNRSIFSYHRFLGAIAPYLRAVTARTGRPARVLELASGAGEFTFLCERLATRRGIPVEVTGSDIVGAYVDAGNREAERRRSPVTFRRINAFDMSDIEPGAYDVAFIAQSLHHFSAGQIAMMIAQCRRICTTAFVGVDGQRSLLLLSTVPLWAAVSGPFDFLHDAVLSTRKFFSEPELELTARLAAPDARVKVRSSHPGYSILDVAFPADVAGP